MAAVTVALALALALAACGDDDDDAGPTTTAVAPLVDGVASEWEVSVDGGQPFPAPEAVVPLLPIRVFTPEEPLAEFGLDSPSAQVTFTGPGGQRVILDVGGENFDEIAYYVRLVEPPDDRIWLVLDDHLDPILDRKQ